MMKTLWTTRESFTTHVHHNNRCFLDAIKTTPHPTFKSMEDSRVKSAASSSHGNASKNASNDMETTTNHGWCKTQRRGEHSNWWSTYRSSTTCARRCAGAIHIILCIPITASRKTHRHQGGEPSGKQHVYVYIYIYIHTNLSLYLHTYITLSLF